MAVEVSSDFHLSASNITQQYVITNQPLTKTYAKTDVAAELISPLRMHTYVHTNVHTN